MILKQFDELLDLNLMSESEKLKYIEDLKRECFLCDQFQATAKTELVSIYGALGNENFHFVNFDMAEAVTMQGQHAIKHSEQAVNDYFLNKFHKDRRLLTKLGVPENVEIKPLKKPVVVYIDTDSTSYDTVITTSNGKIQIGDFFEECAKTFGITYDDRGNEITKSNDTVLNYTNTVVMSKIRKVIRHKVTKKKYKITTTDGKSVEITGDHSLIVIRDGIRTPITVKELKESDLIVCYENNI